MTHPGDAHFNPFPGLRPFQVEEQYLFFGREAQRQELMSLLKTHRFVAVLGASGSGKSSLVRAGLLPALFGGAMLGAGSHWNIAVMRPGGKPIRNLAETLRETELWADREPPSALEIETTLSRSGLGLIELVRQARMPANENLLVVVDQFEELFRFNQSQSERSTRDEASAFISLLLEATRQEQHSIYVVLTMRSDFFGDCAQFEDLAEAVNRGEYLVPRLTRDQKKQAIEGPIKVGGGTLAPRLMQRLLSDVGDDPDQLPILQHALMRTWERWRVDHAEGEPLDLRHYEAIGGLREALSCHADEVFAALPNDQHRLVAEKIFKALTERGMDNRGIRRPTRVHSLGAIAAATDPEVKTVVEAFRRTGCTFLMPPEPTPLAPDTVIDISHESLMRVWQRLRRWVEDEAQSARIYRRLADTSALHAEGKAGLYHDPDLQIALAWRETERPTPAWAGRYHAGFAEAMAFLDQSGAAKRAEDEAREAARRRELEQARALAEAERRSAEEQRKYAGRLQWLVRGLGLVAMIALTAMVVAVVSRNEAEKSKQLAEVRRQEAEQNRKRADEKAEEANQSAKKILRQSYKLQLAQAAEAIKQDDGGLAKEYLSHCDPTLRNWEWDHLALMADGSSHTIQARTNGTDEIGLSLSQDGKSLVSWSWDDGFVGRWDTASVATQKADQPVKSFVVSSTRGKPLLISPDGSWVLVYSRSNHLITVQDIATEKVIGEHSVASNLNDAQISSDGKQIALAFESGEVGRWNLADGKLETWPIASGWIGSVSFNPDGSLIACAGAGGIVRILATSSGSVIREFPANVRWINSMLFSPNGRYVAIGTWTGAVTVFDTALGTGPKETRLRPEGGWAQAPQFAFSRDGQWFAAAVGNAIHVWDAVLFENQTTLRGHKSRVSSICFDADGATLFSAGADGTIKTWPIPGRQDPLELLGHKDDLREVAFSPDGLKLASSGLDGTTRIWDTRTGQELLTLRSERVTAVAWSPDGKRIVSGESAVTNSILVWDAHSGQLDRVLQAHTGGVWWLSFNPDGTVLVSGSQDRTVRLWDATEWKPIGVLGGFQSPVEGAAFSPDGKWIATCETVGGQVILWDARTLQELKRFHGPKVEYRCTVFSHDSKRVAVGTADDSAYVWDIATGGLVKTQPGGAGISSVAFSLDDSRLFTGQRNGIIGVHDSRTGEKMNSFAAGQSVIWCVKSSPDGKTLASSSFAGLQLWETSPIAEATVRQRWIVSAAARAVDRVQQSAKSLDEMLASLRADPSLSAAVREIALQIATAHGEER